MADATLMVDLDLGQANTATHVAAEVATKDETADAEGCFRDVVGWLGRNAMMAEAIVFPAMGSDQHRQQEIAREHKAGLIVAGAYGHGRVRKWIIGGVARALLDDAACCSPLSH